MAEAMKYGEEEFEVRLPAELIGSGAGAQPG